MDEQQPVPEQEIGVVTHYWGDLGVAGVHLTDEVDVGDHIHVVGHTSDFEQDVQSMQIEHEEVKHASPGDDVGIKVVDHAREHDKVYRRVDPSDVGSDEHAL